MLLQKKLYRREVSGLGELTEEDDLLLFSINQRNVYSRDALYI